MPDESRTFSRPEHSIAAGVAILRPRPLVPRGSTRLFFVYTRCRYCPARTHVELVIYAFFSVFCIMADKGNCGEKRKRTNLTISAKLELLKKLDSGCSVGCW